MEKLAYIIASLLTLSMAMPLNALTVENGVSHDLAIYRKANVRDVSYRLSFTIPDAIERPVEFNDTVTFWWIGQEDLQLDFQGQESQLDEVMMVNGKPLETRLLNEHIIIPAWCLRLGENTVVVSGRSGDNALNRHADYLYTLFVPDHARSVFPCFDQPDLKARFDVGLTLPEGWVSITNDTHKPIPTYLFSFTTGKFNVRTAVRDGRTLTALYRETDPDKVAQLGEVFDQVALSLRWMAKYTGIQHPFEKYAFAVLPGYQFGGMEHPGCIQFTDHEIFLGANPSPDEKMTRLNLIAHETAHLWFGDMVTMQWFDDVWTKEVFANFMADKIAREQFPEINHDLAFIKKHYPPALKTDRTQGTHPIRQPLGNLNQAGLLYGNMIYHKAPIVMRKLEQEKGAEALRQGLQSYLRRYAYGNATWDDLIAELDRFAPEHSARAFSDVWVKQKGLPTVTVTQDDANGTARIEQHDPLSRGLVWRQALEVSTANDRAQHLSNTQTVYMQDSTATIAAPGKALIVPNSNGEGYGRYSMDRKTLSWLMNAAPTMSDDMTRYAAVLNLFENFHLGNIEARELFRCFVNCLRGERNVLVASTLCSCISTLTSRLKDDYKPQAEAQLMELAKQHEMKSVRQTLLRQLSVSSTSAAVVGQIYDLWLNQASPLLNRRDYTRTAYHLAIMLPGQWQDILETQRSRLRTNDERNEFDFISRACNPDASVQEELFASLLQAENRRVEPWARQLLALLNDPDREPLSNRYLERGLDALEDVQRTGDIFFPGYWLSSLLAGHRSQQASDIVAGWIKLHSQELPAPLLNKLKENAYWLLKDRQ